MAPNIPAPPPPLSRNRFDRWCWERGIRLGEVGKVLGCNAERARRLRLPFGDALRAIPNEREMSRIVEWTAGAVLPADFYPPRLNGAAEAAAQPEAAQ